MYDLISDDFLVAHPRKTIASHELYFVVHCLKAWTRVFMVIDKSVGMTADVWDTKFYVYWWPRIHSLREKVIYFN